MLNTKEYINILNNKHNTIEEISKKVSIYLPERLYRYRNFSHWEDEIGKGEIYLCSANELNDPMDCLAYFNCSRLPKNCRLTDELIGRYKISYNQIINKYRNEKELENLFEGLREDVKTASFTETNKSLLMWSHYANMHQGFCIEYKTKKMGEILKSKLFPVLYSDTKPDVFDEIKDCSFNAMIKAFVFKASDWKYENEWRVVTSKNNNKYYQAEAVDTIYLGSKCNEENRSKIIELAKAKGKKVVQMKISLKEYKLIEENIF